MSGSRHPITRRWPALAAVLWLTVAPAMADVYGDLMGVLTNDAQRLPGSAAYARSFEALERTLRQAGLDPRVQTFDTLAPRTDRCRLTVNGEPVEPVFPINQGIAALVTDPPVTGPLLWLGDGSLEAMRGKEVKGCVAMLDFDHPRVTLSNVRTPYL